MIENYVQKVRARIKEKTRIDDDALVDLYTLLALTRGHNTMWRDVHDAWSVWKNRTNPTHRSLIPYEQLAREVQELDAKYTTAIHETVNELDL